MQNSHGGAPREVPQRGAAQQVAPPLTQLFAQVRALALKAWGSLKRCAKAGPRRTVPTAEEIEALRTGRTLNTIVFFLDETFEEFHYDITTTVLEAVETLAGIVKLQNYHTFSLFECRKYVVRKVADAPVEEVPDDHIFLDDHKCVALRLAVSPPFRLSRRPSVFPPRGCSPCTESHTYPATTVLAL